jgi:hypothetical protein
MRSPPRIRPLIFSAYLLFWVGLCGFFPQLCSAWALPVAAAPADLTTLLKQGEELRQKILQLEQLLAQANAAQKAREQTAVQKAQEIERRKGEPPGVGRDLALAELLAQAQAQAEKLAQEEQARRRLSEELRATRQRLLVACDRILDADPGKSPGLSSGQRFGWLRLRTAQVEALLGEGSPSQARALARSELDAGNGDLHADGKIDDPQALRDRADLLRDSADKLRREVKRLSTRSEEILHRQRLREQASRVDEDLFAEQATAQRPSTVALSGTAHDNANPPAFNAVAPMPSPMAPANNAPIGGTPMPVPSTTQSPTQTQHNGPDPATLDGLLRVEGPGDPATKLQALSRAQDELQALAADLLRRAARLDQRATALSHQK